MSWADLNQIAWRRGRREAEDNVVGQEGRWLQDLRRQGRRARRPGRRAPEARLRRAGSVAVAMMTMAMTMVMKHGRAPGLVNRLADRRHGA